MVFPLTPRRIDYGDFLFVDSLCSGLPIGMKAFCCCGDISFVHTRLAHPGVDILPSISVAAQRKIFAMPNAQPCLYSERQICDYAVDEGAFAVRK